MKKIIIILLSFTMSLMAQDVKTELQNTLKKLKKCYVKTGEEAMELALSDDGREYHKNYRGAVYYWCDNGYFTYVQDGFTGDFIRGEVCKSGDTYAFGSCESSKNVIWFQLQVYEHDNTWGGWINENDKYGMFIKTMKPESTRAYGEKLMMDLYYTFASRWHK